MNHRGFSLANPNRVRALIGGFTANQTQFNRADGAGFALLEEVVVFLDPTNPQIAARLLTAMRSWRSLEEVRRRPCRGDAEAHRRPTVAVAGRARHRDPEPGLRRGDPPIARVRAGRIGDVATADRPTPGGDCRFVSQPRSATIFPLRRLSRVWTKIRTRILIVVIRA